MANPEHVERLKQGVGAWNDWRAKDFRGKPDLDSADLSDADLSGADLIRAHLDNANLIRAKLDSANLSATHLGGANLSAAHLKGADLKGADLNNARLGFADLGGANLSGAYLVFADLRDAHLSGANLSDANFDNANLSGAYLNNANLSGANLNYANLSNANLSGANLHAIHLSYTIFAWVDLCAVEGLDTVIHDGPSTINVNTVKLPEGKTRTLFLRGAGFSDTFIDYYQSLFTTAIQYASCFISYAHQDETLAQQLYKSLQDKGVRCWFAPEDMKTGDKIRSRIDKAIHMHEKLLLLLSEHSLTSSWVEDEVEAALEKERLQRCEVLVPIRLDESVMQTTQAWAVKLRRTRHISDFTKWTEPQAYQSAFDRLLRDLKQS